jgi:serine/threonine-protein kinase HipA
MEDFAQVFGVFPEDKYRFRSYANIASVLWAERGEEATDEFVRRLVFSVLIGNGDMHLKNWSLLYPDRHTPVFSPAYDFVATFPYIKADKLGLSFGRSKSLDEITADQVRRFTVTAGLPAHPIRKIVKETIERTGDVWHSLKQKDILPVDLKKAIGDHIELVRKNSVNI